jgi:hypothetical protein
MLDGFHVSVNKAARERERECGGNPEQSEFVLNFQEYFSKKIRRSLSPHQNDVYIFLLTNYESKSWLLESWVTQSWPHVPTNEQVEGNDYGDT